MTKKDDDLLTPSTKKIRFRGDLNSYYFDSNHIEDIFEDAERRKAKLIGDGSNADECQKKGINPKCILFIYSFCTNSLQFFIFHSMTPVCLRACIHLSFRTG